MSDRDYVSPWLLGSITLSACSLATFILWGVAGQAMVGLLLFGVAYGLSAGGFTSLWSGFLRPIASKHATLL